MDLLPINVHAVGNRLEGIKGDTDWQQYPEAGMHRLEMHRAQQEIQTIETEAGAFEDDERKKRKGDADGENHFPFSR